MDQIILHAHRGFAYLVLLVAVVFVVALLAAMFGYSGKITKLLKKSTLITMIIFHIQFLVGLGMLLFHSSFLDIVKASGMGSIMKNEELRKLYIEHPFSMLLAAVLLTVVNKKLKSNDKLTSGIVIMGLLAIVLFGYAFLPVSGKLFG